MNRPFDFLTSFLAAVLLHAAGGFFLCAIFSVSGGEVQPLLRQGESSVALTFSNVSPRKKAIRELEPVIDISDGETVLKVDQPQEYNESNIEERDADMASKGVENVPFSDSVVRPEYPFGSRIRGEEGVVSLRVVLGEDGRSASVRIIKSSGFRALDAAAVKAMRRAVFSGLGQGSPAGRTVDQSFRFVLKE